ncbi:HAD family hydrolase [Halomicrobium salinisoli]|uniref:HAD family hydrolase n=1 Tax=Halomicrobium salinisoli TaxID=2878391 RepID=UPI001CF02DC4|nr:HAD hydrolase family protein [Halomicrobium salinisoli]
MERYDQLYALYADFDTETLRAYRDFVDLFPPVDSRVALGYWERANRKLREHEEEIAAAFSDGEAFAELAAHATREQAFTALDLYATYERGVNVLVLDVDETLRSAGQTDNEIPRETLHYLTEFHEAGVPIVICTGQTLENVKGFLIQGLGNELVHSGDVSVVYEAGTGVFTPGHGSDTKRLLYEDLDDAVTDVFDAVRSRILPEAPESIRRGCHLQGNEFNVTLKPNYETGSDDAEAVIDEAMVYVLDLLAEAVPGADAEHTRAYYAAADPEIDRVLDDEGESIDPESVEIPADVASVLDRIDVAYYEADAAEIASRELNKVVGVEAALEVLGVDDPFALVMGDSKSDLRVMEWVAAEDAGIAAAPEHASGRVLEHVRGADGLVFDAGAADDVLRTAFALNRLAERERSATDR